VRRSASPNQIIFGRTLRRRASLLIHFAAG
jgi:hypothetical protein